MTTKPTLGANHGVGTALTSTEWNRDVLQEGRWTQEVIAGTNTDKIALLALQLEVQRASDQPRAILFSTTPQTTPSGVATQVGSGGAATVMQGMTLVGPSPALRVDMAGTYLCGCHISFYPNATGYRQSELMKNGSRIGIATGAPQSTIATALNVVTMNVFAVNDLISQVATQNSGIALNFDFIGIWALRIGA